MSTIQKAYKDRLFRAIFGEKDGKNALSLYNAVNDTDYNDPSQLEVYTIEDAVYMGMKNDLSFIFDDELTLYEHQSTVNPNMPLRGLFYLAKQYEKYIADKGLDPYSGHLLDLPTPKYVVFYNGSEKMPEQSELRLSASFDNSKGAGAVEVVANVLNINYGHNQKLMERCKALRDYAAFVSKVRSYALNTELKNAVNKAVEEAIQEDLLDGYFRRHRAEVTDMILTEWNEMLTLKSREEIGREKGREEGREEGIEEGIDVAKQKFLRVFFARGYSIDEIKAFGYTEKEISDFQNKE